MGKLCIMFPLSQIYNVHQVIEAVVFKWGVTISQGAQDNSVEGRKGI